MKDAMSEEEKQTRDNYRKFLADIVGKTNEIVITDPMITHTGGESLTCNNELIIATILSKDVDVIIHDSYNLYINGEKKDER